MFTFNPSFIAEIEGNLEREEGDDGIVAQYEREPSEDGEVTLKKLLKFSVKGRSIKGLRNW